MSLPLVVTLVMLVACSVAMATRRIQLPYTVALVITGLALSLIRSIFYPDVDLGIHLTQDLLFGLLLPILIYEAAFHLELREFLDNWKAIGTLAILGAGVGIAMASTLIYGALRLFGFELSVDVAILIATILAATDPIGVIALLRETGAPRRLAVLMEGESLLNDAVAVVAYAVVLVALGLDSSQSQITASWLLSYIGWEICGAVLIGGGIGFLFAWLTSKVDDHLIEITLSNIAAFSSFLVAQRFHASGVIACLIAGMFGGNFGAKYGMSATTRIAVESYWEYLAFVANSIVFLLIGLDLDAGALLGDWRAIAIVWTVLLLSRGLFVGIALPPVIRLEGALPKGTGWVISWGGVRGSIAMVLALSLPADCPQRSLVLHCIFGVSLLTILVQSTTMQRLLRHFSMIGTDDDESQTLAQMHGRLRSWEAAAAYLERQREAGALSGKLYDSIHQELLSEQKAIQSEQKAMESTLAHLQESELRLFKRQMLHIRKEALKKAAVEGVVDRATLRRLVGEVDETLHELRLHQADDDNVEESATEGDV
jgi:monovalent cation:H+ antiporter, CPA1 family